VASEAVDNLLEAIATGLEALDLASTESPRLAELLHLLARWNKTYNLTAIRIPADMVVRHVLDSAAVLPFLDGQRILDAGAGAGFPGLPVAILRPSCQVLLLDGNAKKTRFMAHAIGTLKISNAQVANSRLEAYRADPAFDTVVSRALSTLTDFVRLCGHLVKPGGRLVAMKGRMPCEELDALPAGWQATTHPIDVPGLNAERHVVVMQRN
jgi:16S rRNA (guanine527-N7)-methyltransferase